MPKTKIEEFTDDEIQLADLAKALSHPARIKIIKILASLDVCVCGEIVDKLPLAQATVSQHLKELKHAGLINGHAKKPFIKYCINKENWSTAKKLFNELFNE